MPILDLKFKLLNISAAVLLLLSNPGASTVLATGSDTCGFLHLWQFVADSFGKSESHVVGIFPKKKLVFVDNAFQSNYPFNNILLHHLVP